MAAGRLHEIGAEVIGTAALAVVGIAVGILGAPQWVGYLLLGLAVVLGLFAMLRWWRGRLAESAPTPAPPPRRGLVTQTENSTATQWEDGTRDVSVVAIPAYGTATGRPATVGVPLLDRMVDLANRVLACAPNGHEQPPFKIPNAYGIEQDMATFATSATAGDEHIADEQGVMTDELWAEVRDAIEELGRQGYTSYLLQPYLNRRPETSECVHLASEIYLQASKMVTG
jgi:hypothetical protein